MTTFMSLRFRDYTVHSGVTGGQIDLKAQTRADALYTGAELLGEPVENLAVYQPNEWN